MGEVQAETTGGRVRGVRDEGVSAFLGVPYAAPPTGAARFRPPGPLEPWAGVRDAIRRGPSCPQVAARPDGWPPETEEDEDCLVLNVWTPAATGGDGGRRPVLVFFHGGGFTIGSGSWPLYDGAALARRGDAVVVTVNHRLGPFGYLYLAELLGDEFAASGNVGMLDLVAALEWVRDNIVAFGGDPGTVMIFGESGGGAKVSHLLAMPQARGLFHRAAIQSGPAQRARSPRRATEEARRVLAELGIDATAPAADQAAALRAVPARALVEAHASAGGGRGVSLGGPVLDGVVLDTHPGDALVAGTAADVPLLLGTTRDEATLFLANDPVFAAPDSLDDAGVVARVAYLGDQAAGVVAAYRRARPDASALDLLVAIQSDLMMRVPTIRYAEKKASAGAAPVYLYLFCWEAGPLRSGHGFELPFVFDNVREPVMHPSERRRQLAHRMAEAWLAFARDGDPNHPDLPKWPALSTDDRPTMVFDGGECEVVEDPFGAERQAWDDVSVRGW